MPVVHPPSPLQTVQGATADHAQSKARKAAVIYDCDSLTLARKKKVTRGKRPAHLLVGGAA